MYGPVWPTHPMNLYMTWRLTGERNLILIESNRIFIQKGMMGSWRSERVHNNRARINVNISDMIFNNAHRHSVECHVVGGVPVQLLLCCPIPVIALAGLFPG